MRPSRIRRLNPNLQKCDSPVLKRIEDEVGTIERLFRRRYFA
jgi:hypothetical protein